MTGNFHPEIVTRAAELMRAGIDPDDLRRQVHREFPVLTRLGIERVIDLAIAERGRRESAA